MDKFIVVKNFFLAETAANENENKLHGEQAEQALCNMAFTMDGCLNETTQLIMAMKEPETNGNDSCLSCVVRALEETGTGILYGKSHKERTATLRNEVTKMMFNSTNLKETMSYLRENITGDPRVKARLIPVEILEGFIHEKTHEVAKENGVLHEENTATRYKKFVGSGGAFGALEITERAICSAKI